MEGRNIRRSKPRKHTGRLLFAKQKQDIATRVKKQGFYQVLCCFSSGRRCRLFLVGAALFGPERDINV